MSGPSDLDTRITRAAAEVERIVAERDRLAERCEALERDARNLLQQAIDAKAEAAAMRPVVEAARLARVSSPSSGDP